jgi:hypothetical protein
MTQNNDILIHKCLFCNYQTIRKYDLKRHHNNKHLIKLLENNVLENNGQNVIPKRKNVIPKRKNVIPNEKNVIPNEKIVIPKENMCKKCNKYYKTKKSLIEHEKNCKGIDDLTCCRCMISFTNRHNKARHMKKNNCKSRSIIYARTPNPQNLDNERININNIQNIYVNSYGSERLDYLKYDKMFEIFTKKYNIPTLLIKEIHFNNKFPENNNIKFLNNKEVLIKKDEDFVYNNLNNLVNDLIKKNIEIMQKFAKDNKDNICLNMNSDLYDEIIEILLKLLIVKEPVESFKELIRNIKEIIKNTNIINE